VSPSKMAGEAMTELPSSTLYALAQKRGIRAQKVGQPRRGSLVAETRERCHLETPANRDGDGTPGAT